MTFLDPSARAGNSPSRAKGVRLVNQESDAMTLDERLRRVGALMATGAIRAVLKERSSQSAESGVAQQDDSDGQEGADTRAAVPL